MSCAVLRGDVSGGVARYEQRNQTTRGQGIRPPGSGRVLGARRHLARCLIRARTIDVYRECRNADRHHKNVECLPVWQAPKRVRIIAKHVDRYSQDCVENYEKRGDSSGRHVAASHPEKDWDEQEILKPVVEHDRMTKAPDIWKLHAQGKSVKVP